MMLPRPGQATLFTGSSGPLSASADFSVVNGQLQVLLTNTGGASGSKGMFVPQDVLTAVFFNVLGDPAFTSISAVLGQGSTVIQGGTTPTNGVVGGEWGYASGLSTLPGGTNYGISSSGAVKGLGHPTFPGDDLNHDHGALGGFDYGIVPTTYSTANANKGLKKQPLIKNSVLFTLAALDNVPLNFDPGKFITDVSFQYGTGLDEPRYAARCTNCSPPGGGGSNSGTDVPEPATLLLFGTAAALLLVRRARGA
jgi:hypothetical protein